MEFNCKLYDLRKKNGMSQEELGHQLGVSRQTVSKWELGDSMPDVERLVTISQLFDISLDELVLSKEVREKTDNKNKTDNKADREEKTDNKNKTDNKADREENTDNKNNTDNKADREENTNNKKEDMNYTNSQSDNVENKESNFNTDNSKLSDLLYNKIFTSENKKAFKKVLKIAGIVFGVFLAIDVASFIIYIILYGLPQ